jgi:hypothetical protein
MVDASSREGGSLGECNVGEETGMIELAEANPMDKRARAQQQSQRKVPTLFRSAIVPRS